MSMCVTVCEELNDDDDDDDDDVSLVIVLHWLTPDKIKQVRETISVAKSGTMYQSTADFLQCL